MMNADAAAIEIAGRKFFCRASGNNKSAGEELLELIGGKVALRFYKLRDWQAVDLEGLEDAKHLARSTDADSIYMFVLLCEIAPDAPTAAYQRLWSATVTLAEFNWATIVQVAGSLRQPAVVTALRRPS